VPRLERIQLDRPGAPTTDEFNRLQTAIERALGGLARQAGINPSAGTGGGGGGGGGGGSGGFPGPPGAVVYVGPTGFAAFDQPHFFWDVSTHRLGIGTTTPRVALDLNGTIYEKGPRADVRAYGAKGDGVTDDTAAFQSALNASTNVYIPAGNYIISNLTITTDGTRMYGDGELSLMTMLPGATGPMIATGAQRATLESFRLFGGIITSMNGVSSPPADRSGIFMNTQFNSHFLNLTIHGFGTDAIAQTGGGGDRQSHAILENLSLYNCWLGLGMDAVNTEYTRVSNVDIHDCYYGLSLRAGNVTISNSKINDNHFGFYLYGTGNINNGHGNMLGCLLNHNAEAVHAEDITIGFNIIGCNAFAGDIVFKNSQGVHIEESIVDVDNYYFDGGGNNYIRFNYIQNGNANVIHHNFNGHADSTFMIDNWINGGTFLDSNRYLFAAATIPTGNVTFGSGGGAGNQLTSSNSFNWNNGTGTLSITNLTVTGLGAPGGVVQATVGTGALASVNIGTDLVPYGAASGGGLTTLSTFGFNHTNQTLAVGIASASAASYARVHANGTSTAGVDIVIQNTSNGTHAFSELQFINDANRLGSLYWTSSTYTGIDAIPNVFVWWCDASSNGVLFSPKGIQTLYADGSGDIFLPRAATQSITKTGSGDMQLSNTAGGQIKVPSNNLLFTSGGSQLVEKQGGGSFFIGTQPALLLGLYTNNTDRLDFLSTGETRFYNVPAMTFSTAGGSGLAATAPTMVEWSMTPASIASAASLNALHAWDAVTLTLTGTTHHTGTNLALAKFYAPTVTDASAVTVDTMATLAIGGAPVAAGSVTLTNPLALDIQSGAWTHDNATGANFEWVRAFWSSNIWNLKSEKGGTGTVRSIVIDTTAGTADITVKAGNNINLNGATAVNLYTALGTNPDILMTTTQTQHRASMTVASAAGAIWDGIGFNNTTLTLSGSAHVTNTSGINMVAMTGPTINGTLTVDFASTLAIYSAPVAGTATLTNRYGLWVQALSRFDGDGTAVLTVATTANGAVATAMTSLGPTGSHTTIQEWLAVRNQAGTVRYIPMF